MDIKALIPMNNQDYYNILLKLYHSIRDVLTYGSNVRTGVAALDSSAHLLSVVENTSHSNK